MSNSNFIERDKIEKLFAAFILAFGENHKYRNCVYIDDVRIGKNINSVMQYFVAIEVEITKKSRLKATLKAVELLSAAKYLEDIEYEGNRYLKYTIPISEDTFKRMDADGFMTAYT